MAESTAPPARRAECGHCGTEISRTNRVHQQCFPAYRDAALRAADSSRCTIVEHDERCPRPRVAMDWCKIHHQRWTRTGDPTTVTRRPAGELMRLVQEAATVTDRCVLVPNAKSRPTLIYKGRPTIAARAVWIEATGEDPGDQQVLHSCHRGDAGCIAFGCLRLGSHAENMVDRSHAGSQSGELNGLAVLTWEKVRAIRAEYVPRLVSQRFLATKYGVSQGVINQILTGRTWREEQQETGQQRDAVVFAVGAIPAQAPSSEALEAEFWSHVDTQGGDMDACWLWTGDLQHQGYGVWKGVLAHRQAYVLTHGPIPERDETGARIVLDHACHDPAVCEGGDFCPHRRCVNPYGHLAPVTQRVNTSPSRSSRNWVR
ncbi:hypothetical protein [Streptomyces chilikensis]|uniref:Uncharacterized protein n=1 Tax=Streptomyces chilikensis TaxID=1194079 RepID=A0ABV3EJB9_9ACTN